MSYQYLMLTVENKSSNRLKQNAVKRVSSGIVWKLQQMCLILELIMNIRN